MCCITFMRKMLNGKQMGHQYFVYEITHCLSLAEITKSDNAINVMNTHNH